MAERGAVLSKAIPLTPKGVNYHQPQAGCTVLSINTSFVSFYSLHFLFPHSSVHKPTHCKIRCVFAPMLIRKNLLFVQIYLEI